MFAAMWEHLKNVMLHEAHPEELSKQHSETTQHDAFCDTRDTLYVGGETYFSRLNQMLSNRKKLCHRMLMINLCPDSTALKEVEWTLCSVDFSGETSGTYLRRARLWEVCPAGKLAETETERCHGR